MEVIELCKLCKRERVNGKCTTCGQPTIYREKMLPVLLDMASKGASVVEVCAKIGISKETHYQWLNKDSEYFNKDYSDVALRAKELCEAWWIAYGRENLKEIGGKRINSNIYALHMMNRFGWGKNQKTEHSGNLNLTALSTLASNNSED